MNKNYTFIAERKGTKIHRGGLLGVVNRVNKLNVLMIVFCENRITPILLFSPNGFLMRVEFMTPIICQMCVREAGSLSNWHIHTSYSHDNV